MSFIVGSELDRKILDIVGEADVRCAVAFIGAGAADRFCSQGSAKIICNLSSGCCNPGEIRKLQERGHHIRQMSDLHAKVYIGRSDVVVTSANLSANGLGFEQLEIARWIEAGNCIARTSEIDAWFKTMWDNSLEVGGADLGRAEALWRVRRSVKPVALRFEDFDPQLADFPLLEWWAPAPEREISTDDARKRLGIDGNDAERLIDDAYVLEDDDDAELLANGRWVLWWRLTDQDRRHRSVRLAWARYNDILLKKSWRSSSDGPWRNVLLANRNIDDAPFLYDEDKFHKAFDDVIGLENFKDLRCSDYGDRYLTPNRVCLMKDFWSLLSNKYRSL